MAVPCSCVLWPIASLLAYPLCWTVLTQDNGFSPQAHMPLCFCCKRTLSPLTGKDKSAEELVSQTFTKEMGFYFMDISINGIRKSALHLKAHICGLESLGLVTLSRIQVYIICKYTNRWHLSITPIYMHRAHVRFPGPVAPITMII